MENIRGWIMVGVVSELDAVWRGGTGYQLLMTYWFSILPDNGVRTPVIL